jgi:hypothetical protein
MSPADVRPELIRGDTMAHAARGYIKPARRPKKPKRRDCLRCDREFWSEGPHHRLCHMCRQVIAASPSPEEEYSVFSLPESGVPGPTYTARPWL